LRQSGAPPRSTDVPCSGGAGPLAGNFGAPFGVQPGSLPRPLFASMTVADRIRAKILPALFACLVVFPLDEARAQLYAEVPGSELTVYLMTMGPDEIVWERDGHNAILIRDELRETDIAYNLGMFSFDQENFILRFIRGEM